MKKLVSILACVAMAAAFIIVPAKDVKANATSDGYVLTQQAEELVYYAQRERDDAQRSVDYSRRKVDDLRNSGASSDQINAAYDELNRAYATLDRKNDKVSKARNVLNFVNTRSSSEIFLASMQEKFRNEATLYPMQEKIQGAKSILQAQQTQLQVIQQAINSQTALAQTNPALMAQVNELNVAYQQELAQYQQEQLVLAELQKQYDTFAATMPLPTAADRMKLAEIRSDFIYACKDFDAACAE